MKLGSSGVRTCCATIRSISVMAASSIFQPSTSPTGSSWAGWRAPHKAIGLGTRSSTQRQVDHTLAEVLMREAIERGDGREILGKVRGLEFGIRSATQIGCRKFGVGTHPPGKEPAAQGAIGQHREPVLTGIGKNIGLD